MPKPVKSRSASVAKTVRSTSSPRRKERPDSGRTIRSPRPRENKKRPSTLRIVGIGASAGGLEALETFFRAIPPNTGAAFVVVTHLQPDQVSILPQILSQVTPVPVRQIVDGMAVKPNEVYVIPPNSNLGIMDKQFQLVPRERDRPSAPINYFLRALASEEQEFAVAVILSGTGSDGADGARAIKAEFGLVIAQEPDTALFKGMPEAAIQTRIVDYILPPDQMPAKLLQYFEANTELANRRSRPDSNVRDSLQKIFYILRTATGHDFSQYKQNTVLRRVERRMRVQGLNTIERYVAYLRQNSPEAEVLFRELLIGVTEFFRDKDAFDVLRERVLPAILGGKDDNHSVRVWVPGAATGEEAFSVAMIVQEYAEHHAVNIRVQIFATDINQDAVDFARRATYPPSIEANVSHDRLRHFFVRDDHGYKVKRDIREMVTFSTQNMIKDPPFTKLDLICCRNLLIYLDTDLQKRILPLFHYCLKPDGILFLGSSESIGEYSNLFSPLDSKWKIYQRNELDTAAQSSLDYSLLHRRAVSAERDAAFLPTRSVPQIVERQLLEMFAPSCAIVNRQGEVFYIHGRTGKYLEPAPGHANLNIFDMAREGLNARLHGLISKAGVEKKTVRADRLKVHTEGEAAEVNVVVHPISNNRNMEGLLMVTFEDVTAGNSGRATKRKPGRKRVPGSIESLELELAATRENLQTSIEELQTSNEELRSMNEEFQSTNEELQSANEELETSREELHSLNEELSTVNTELQDKIDDITRAHQDLEVFLNGLEIPTIFLDRECRVIRFTPQAQRLVNLVDHDIGRPLSHITSNLEGASLLDEASRVLESLRYTEKEVKGSDGKWYLMRVVPYQRSGSEAPGLAITFVNIDELKSRNRDLAQMRAGREHAEEIIEAIPIPLIVVDENQTVLTANDAFFAAFRLSRRNMLGKPIAKSGDGIWNSVALTDAIHGLIHNDVPIENLEIQADLPGGITRKVAVYGRELMNKDNGRRNILLAAHEKTTQ